MKKKHVFVIFLCILGFLSQTQIATAQPQPTPSVYKYDYDASGNRRARALNIDEFLKSGTVSETKKPVLDAIADFEIKIFPNPVQNELNIEFYPLSELIKLPVVQLFNISGQLVTQTKVNGNQATIDVSALIAGMYILKFTNDQEVLEWKIIKN